MGFPGCSDGKNQHAMQEARARSPGWEDPLGNEMATHSSILDWIIPQTEEPGGLQLRGSHRVRHDWATNNSWPNLVYIMMSFYFPFIFISWRLITLQYCSGFCHTLTWISHGFTCIPHPDPSVLMRWMKLEPIIQSEVSQKDKDQYSILMHTYGI